ncbi:DUF2076 domain-containing protein [Yokenella regensburgei]|uniref:DUF2076 domain-containing protein n=1 Tax=Yokenella regensburgei TaxID=158877 RepID=UPI003F148ECA
MQHEEQRLIEGLFQRLKQAEQQSGARDAQAERIIEAYVRQQPAAAYYMAQSILIQEAALTRLHDQVQALQNEVATLKTQQPAGGSFLSSLFGGGKTQPQAQQGNTGTPPPYSASGTQLPPAAPSRAGGFMSGALQTAAGVAGGVVLADMLTSMFHHAQPEEIVNIIEPPVTPEADFTRDHSWGDPSQDSFLQASDNRVDGLSEDTRDPFFDQSSDDDFDTSNDDDGFI